MSINRMIRDLVAGGLAAASAAVACAQGPITPAFTYQGELRSASQPATGTHDFRFRLFDSPAGGSPLGPDQCVDNIAVVDGAFSATLDFGTQFAGQKRYLEILVRADPSAVLGCGNAAGYITLSPRQELTPTPHANYAVAAGNAATLNNQPPNYYRDAANLTGTLPDARLSTAVARTNAVNAFTNPGNTFTGSGAGLTGLNASNVSSGQLSRSVLPPSVAHQDQSNVFTQPTFIGPGSLLAFQNSLGRKLQLYSTGGDMMYGVEIAPYDMRLMVEDIAARLSLGFSTPGHVFNPLLTASCNEGVIIHPARGTYALLVDGDAGVAGTLTAAGTIYAPSGLISDGTVSATDLVARGSVSLDNSRFVLFNGRGHVQASEHLYLQPHASSGYTIVGGGGGNGRLEVSGLLTAWGGLACAGPIGGGRVMLGVRPTPFSDPGSGFYIDSNGIGLIFANIKFFRVDNPRDPETHITYACVEGPEAAMYIRGTGRLVDGRAVIDLPDHFRDLASANGITVQLTPLSANCAGLAVTRKSLDGIEVAELLQGASDAEFDWEVKAVRKEHENFKVIRPKSEIRPSPDGHPTQQARNDQRAHTVNTP